MRKDLTPRQKADLGLALNMGELAHVTGYCLSSLRQMELPMLHHKITLRDFWRIMRKRQDEIEDAKSKVAVYENGKLKFTAFHPKPLPVLPVWPIEGLPSVTGWRSPAKLTTRAEAVEGDRRLQAIVDKFRAPRSKNGQQDALPSLAARRPRNNA